MIIFSHKRRQQLHSLFTVMQSDGLTAMHFNNSSCVYLVRSALWFYLHYVYIFAFLPIYHIVSELEIGTAKQSHNSNISHMYCPMYPNMTLCRLSQGVTYDHVELNLYLNGKNMHCPASGIRGTVYPVVYGKSLTSSLKYLRMILDQQLITALWLLLTTRCFFMAEWLLSL